MRNVFERIARYLAPFVQEDASPQAVPRLHSSTEDSSPSRPIVFVGRRPSYLEQALLRELRGRHAGTAAVKPVVSTQRDLSVSLRARSGEELFTSLRRREREKLHRVLERATEFEFIPFGFFAGKGPKPIPRQTYWPIDFSWLPLGDIWLAVVFFVHRRALTLSLGPSVIPSEPLSPKSLSRRLSQLLYRTEKQARGAKQLSHSTVRSIVLADPRVEAEVLRQCEETGLSRGQVLRRASKIFGEIAADIKGRFVYLLYLILDPVIRRVFSSIQVENLERLRNVIGERPVVLLPSHRSHFDYIVLSYVLYQAHLPLPYIAAGANLNFWPVGALARATGGFFIRRSFGGDDLYKTVLDSYVQYLLKQGQILEFFIEGGRSRTGGMRVPRLGLLKYLIRSWDSGARADLFVVPVGITYERLAEEQSLASELAGGRKEKESVLQLLHLRRLIRRKFGSVVVVLGEPRSVRDIRNAAAVEEEFSLARFTEDVGFLVGRSIRDSMAITGVSLGATALLMHPGQAPRAAIEQSIVELLSVLGVWRGMPGAEIWDCETELGPECCQILRQQHGLWFSSTLAEMLSTESLGVVAERVVEAMLSLGFVEAVIGQSRLRSDVLEVGDSPEVRERAVVQIVSAKRYALEYYKNSLLHLFVEPAAVCFAALTGSLMLERLHWFHQFFKPMFLFPYFRVWSEQLATKLAELERIGWTSATGPIEGIKHAQMSSSLVVTGLGHLGLQPALELFSNYLSGLAAALSALSTIEDEPISRSEFRVRWQSRVEFQIQAYLEPIERHLSAQGFLSGTVEESEAGTITVQVPEQKRAEIAAELQMLEQTLELLAVPSEFSL